MRTLQKILISLATSSLLLCIGHASFAADNAIGTHGNVPSQRHQHILSYQRAHLLEKLGANRHYSLGHPHEEDNTPEKATTNPHPQTKNKVNLASNHEQTKTDANPSHAHASQATQGPRLWNLRDTDIRNVISEVSRETGKNFLVDPRVNGRVSIVSNTPMNKDDIYQVFLSVLQVSGYDAIPSGKLVKIMPAAESQRTGTPVIAPGQGKGDEMAVSVIQVKNVSAQELVPILRPLLPQWSNLAAYAPSNVLIISGHADNISRIAQIVKRVDTVNHNGIDIIPLYHAAAADVVKTVKALQSNSKNLPHETISIAADSRSNSVLISGNAQSRLRTRVLVSDLDTPETAGSATTNDVIYLHYQKAKDVVPILAAVAHSNYSGPVETVIGPSPEDKYSTAGDNNTFASSNLPATTATQSTAQIDSNQSSTQTSNNGKNSAEVNKATVEIIGEPNTNSIIISAPPSLLRTLKSVLHKIDIRPAQVLVEAFIAEINEKEVTQLGIDWGSFSVNDKGKSIGAFQSGVGILSKIVFDNDFKNYQAVIRTLATENKANILSTPSLLVLDNHQARIVVGTEISVLKSEYPNNAGGSTTSGSPFQTFDRETIALYLYVTPQISHGNTVKLFIDQGNDSLQNPDSDSTTPLVDRNSIKTSVIVNSGDVLVLGGLMKNDITNERKKVSILGDIPIVGRLFTDKAKNQEKKNLMVFIRPVIMHDDKDNLEISGKQYNATRQKQLLWLKKQVHKSGSEHFTLPPIQDNLNLPQPFAYSHSSPSSVIPAQAGIHERAL